MRLEDRLRHAAPPDAAGARERASRVVLEAAPAVERRGRRLPALVAAAVLVTGLALTPPGDAVAKWLRDLVETQPHVRAPSVARLPSGGSVLAAGPSGTYVGTDGRRWRRISSYGQPMWSPHGLYVAVARAHDLRVIDPRGEVRWTLETAGSVSDPRWSQDGYRIAYRRDDDLRVVAGDGSGDHPLVDSVAAVPAAWQAGAAHRVAVARASGRVELWAADTGRRVWARRAGDVRLLAWTPGGRLVAVTGDRLLVLAGTGRVLSRRALAGGVAAAALAPDGARLALRRDRSVSLLALTPGAPEQVRLLLGGVTSLVWAPDGQAVLAAAGDGWYFVPVGGGPIRATSVRGPAGGFEPTGWCC
jgi:dipeptidyl aminopeptidase/acylaminoacyl peptidase